MAYKCENCGSTNIKVDYKVAYTSLPEKYGYCCQDCGEKGFVTSSEYVGDYLEDLSNLGTTIIGTTISTDKTPRDIVDMSGNEDLNKKINTQDKNKGGGLMGWVCPKCGRCYSPFTSMCQYCNNGIGDWNGFKVTC